MPRYIVKLKDLYFEYSTIVDAPVSYGLSLDEFKEYYAWEHGQDGMIGLQRRLDRVEKFGSSSAFGESAEEVLEGNRAGPNETELTIDEIYEQITNYPEEEE